MNQKESKTVFEAPEGLPLAKSESKSIYHQVVVQHFMLDKPLPLSKNSEKQESGSLA